MNSLGVAIGHPLRRTSNSLTVPEIVDNDALECRKRMPVILDPTGRPTSSAGA